LTGFGAIQYALVTIPHTVKSAPHGWHNLQEQEKTPCPQFFLGRTPRSAINPSRITEFENVDINECQMYIELNLPVCDSKATQWQMQFEFELTANQQAYFFVRIRWSQ
jgi:hypothetical protein